MSQENNQQMQGEDKNKKLYEPDAAKFLGVSRSTLRNIRRANEIGFYKWRSKVYYSVAQLEAYQNRHEVKPRAAYQPLRRVK